VPAPAPESPLSPCVVVVKTPVASRKGMADRLARTGRRLAGEVSGAASEQERTAAALQEALARLGVTPLTLSVDALGAIGASGASGAGDAKTRRALAGARLVISVGGDGTLLAASHWVTGAALLGVNSAPQTSVGYTTIARRANIARTLARIASGVLLPQPVARLEIELEGEVLPPALNDVLLAHEQPAATSRYRLHLSGARRRAESHRSSGLWIATAVGSTAGIRSAGGQPMPLADRRLQFRARELYRAQGRAVHLESGFVEPGRSLVVESAMEAGWLFVDGSRIAVRFPFGARATFRTARQPLRLFADPARWAGE
jgi:NAD+ kinase